MSDKAKAGIRPVYMSEREAIRKNNDLLQSSGFVAEDLRNPAEFSDDPILIGIEITDPDIVTKMGVEAKWKSRKTTFVLGRCANSKDDDMTVLIITTIINAAFK